MDFITTIIPPQNPPETAIPPDREPTDLEYLDSRLRQLSALKDRNQLAGSLRAAVADAINTYADAAIDKLLDIRHLLTT